MIQMLPKLIDYSFIEILENSSDLESKEFLQYLAQNSQDKLPFMILLLKAWRYFKLISKIG
jgi:hypothetical protein